MVYHSMWLFYCYMYIYTYTYIHIYLYVYIYRKRERDWGIEGKTGWIQESGFNHVSLEILITSLNTGNKLETR